MTPGSPRPLRIAVLCSRRAPGLLRLLHTDARRGVDYEIVTCVTSEESFDDEPGVERRGIPVLSHPARAFHASRGAKLSDRAVRMDYDCGTLQLLAPFRPDVVVLAGYLLVLTEPMLDTFEGRILNIHHSDLYLRRPDGGPRYPGLRAVRDALFEGEKETRASAHVVTPFLDDGPVILRSWPFPVPVVAEWALRNEASAALRAYAWAHQEWMLRTAWPPMLARTIQLAGLGFSSPDDPLDLAAIGSWTLEEDGVIEEEAAVGRR